MSFQRVLIPIDFSEYSQAAFVEACELAKSNKSELHLVHVLDARANADSIRQAQQQLMSMTPPALELQVALRREILHGSIHHCIVDYATKNQMQLIVMGTRGRSGLAQIALGSTALRVSRISNCPVMLITPSAKSIPASNDDASARYEAIRVSDSPALDLVARAISLRVTDIHIDPFDSQLYQIRFRIDGQISPYCQLDLGVAEHLINQYYGLAKVDMMDPFRPREGRLRLPESMHDTEVRLTAAPVAGGDAVALRLFSKENIFLPLDRLGFSEKGLEGVRQMLDGYKGLILVTGPTGSGKTTTVYSMLEQMSSHGQHNIVSIEDPVEFAVPFVRQLSVDEKHGLSMTSGLRTLLRMDPDILFVGEIRDPEAANIALRAASSGRFVLSSLHTRDVAATITALRDCQATDRSLSGNLVGIINQRLVRRLCNECRVPFAIDTATRDLFLEFLNEVPSQIFDAPGCSVCRGTGFQGRCGVFEVVVCSPQTVEAIGNGVSESDFRSMLRSMEVPNLFVESLRKVRDGITSMKEIHALRS